VDEGTLYTIGDLARRTGLPVRTIRFYSDTGLLPPTDRSPANHRRYDLTAITRLVLIRTLRGLLRSTMPNLPDEPTAEQVEAWIELARLVQDTDFRAGIRRMAEHQAAERADGDRTGLHRELTDHVIERVTAAVTAGIQPPSAAAAEIVAELVARYAGTFGKIDNAEYRADLLTRMGVANDPRVEQYWHLISTINGWPAPPSIAPVFYWLIRSLQHHGRP
jgi:DNA-binding transcriptional MerR regulator